MQKITYHFTIRGAHHRPPYRGKISLWIHPDDDPQKMIHDRVKSAFFDTSPDDIKINAEIIDHTIPTR